MNEDELLEEPAGSELGEPEEHDDAERAVASSMVSSWGYDRENEQIQVSFNNGSSHSYGCTPEQWEEAKEAVSPGRFMHENFI